MCGLQALAKLVQLGLYLLDHLTEELLSVLLLEAAERRNELPHGGEDGVRCDHGPLAGPYDAEEGLQLMAQCEAGSVGLSGDRCGTNAPSARQSRKQRLVLEHIVAFNRGLSIETPLCLCSRLARCCAEVVDALGCRGRVEEPLLAEGQQTQPKELRVQQCLQHRVEEAGLAEVAQAGHARLGLP